MAADRTNALIHLYRAEVGRLTAYRQRLDTTTSWAISSSALVGTIAFGTAGLSHASFVFLMFLIYLFLHLEARRFRLYEISRQRVELIERHFYPQVIKRTREPDDERWEDVLLDALAHPTDQPHRWAAVGWRLRRIYMGIYVGVLLAWLIRLDVAGSQTVDLTTLVERAAIGSIPGWFVFGIVLVLYLALALLTASARRLYPEGDDWSRKE